MAQLDTNLATGFRAPAIKSLNEVEAERLKLQGAKQDVALNEQSLAANALKLQGDEAKLAEGKRKQQGVEKLSELLAQHSTVDERGQRKVDHAAIMKGLAESGHGPEALAYDTTRRADELADLNNQKSQLEISKAKGAQFASIVNGALQQKTPESANRGIGSLLAGGFIDEKQAAEMLAAPKDESFWGRVTQLRDEHIEVDKDIDLYGKEIDIRKKKALLPFELDEAKLKNTELKQKTTGTVPLQEKDKAEIQNRKDTLAQQALENDKNRKVTMRGQDIQAAKQNNGGAGRNLPEGAINKLEEGKGFSDLLGGLESSFNDKFAGNTVTGGLENIAGKLGGESMGLTTEGQTDWWQGYQDYVNSVRNKLFGAALSPTEAAEFNKAIVSPSTDPKVVRTNIARQRQIIETALNRRADTYKAGGFNQGQVDLYRPQSGAQKQLEDVSKPRGGKFVFTAPNGKQYPFDSQEKLDDFKRRAGQ